jgi:L-fucose isomerase-like protein
MKIIPKIGFCVMYHPFEENAENAPNIFQDSIKLLRSIKDLEIIGADKLVYDLNSAIMVGNQFKQAGVDLICIKLATWSSDDYILDMSSIYDVPFIFWTYPHMHAGSMCGGLQFNMVFKELNKECIFVYKDDSQALEKIKNYAMSVSLRNQLKLIRFLKVGHRTQGMAEVICDEFSVKQIFGPRIISIGFENFYEIVDNISDNDAVYLWNDVKNEVGKVSVNNSEGILAIKNYLVLKNIIEIEKVSGITVECYPKNMGDFCLGFSLLANEGIPGACEGDINSLLLMYILTKLSGTPVHNIDPLYLYDDDNSIIGSHCGCGSFNLAESKNDIEFANVRLAKRGLCVLFPSKPGTITLANLVGRKNTYRLGVIEGQAIQTDMIFPGNPIRIKLSISTEKYLERIEKYGLGHHWIIAYGSHSDSLKYLASLLQINYIEF